MPDRRLSAQHWPRRLIVNRERRLLDRLNRVLSNARSAREIALARWELRQFYRGIGLHP